MSPNPTPTPTSSSWTSPAPCATPDIANANLVVVAMASAFVPFASQSYGNIGGYAVIDPTGAALPPLTSTLISQTVNGNPITAQNTLQFVNLEPEGSTALHSATGFLTTSFPTKPYTFPTPLASPVASVITNTTPWSTGLLSSPVGPACYSREFTVRAGTYYFGDFDFYDLTTFQDVLVVNP